MKSNCKFAVLLTSALLILVSCSSAEEQIRTEFDTLSPPNSTLLYEYTDTSSSATGDCAGMFIDRWYGSEIAYSDLVGMYEDQLWGEGWVLWPEDVVRIWRKQGQTSLFSLHMQELTDQDMGNPVGLYELPASFLLEAANYPTVYAISLSYMSNFAAKRCFGR
jgi:hypothetical protein